PGDILGTPSYMAPEQARGEQADARSDLFSLGCVLYRMLTGRAALGGATVAAQLLAVATETPPPAHEQNPAIPPALSALVQQLLAKDPAVRPASAEDIIGQIERLEREAEV